MSLAAGRLQHRINIEEPADIVDSNGLRSTVWTLFAERVAAEVAPLSARELMASQARQSEQIGNVTMRPLEGLKANMRFLYRGKYFNIAGIVEDNKSGLEWITLPYSTGLRDNEPPAIFVIDGGSPESVGGGGFDGGEP